MKVIPMKIVEEDRHVETEAPVEADYKLTAGILTFCGNNANV